MAAPLYGLHAYYDSAMASYWDTQTFQTGTIKTPMDPGTFRGSICSVQFARTEAATIREDIAQFDLHLAINDGVGAFAVLDDTDSAAVESKLDTWWTSQKTAIGSHWKLNGYVWRDFGMDYPLGETGLSKPGPTRRTTSRSVAATGTEPGSPDQTSTTVTFITASRKHWGRIYLPAPANNQLGSYGRLSSASVDATCGFFHTLLNDMNDDARQIDTFVWSPKYRGALSVWKLQMDDVPDVVRRRRPKVATYRKVYTS